MPSAHSLGARSASSMASPFVLADADALQQLPSTNGLEHVTVSQQMLLLALRRRRQNGNYSHLPARERGVPGPCTQMPEMDHQPHPGLAAHADFGSRIEKCRISPIATRDPESAETVTLTEAAGDPELHMQVPRWAPPEAASRACAIAWKHASDSTPPALRSPRRPAPSLASERFAEKRASGSRSQQVARRSRFRPEAEAKCSLSHLSRSSHPLASGSNTAAQLQMQERRLFVLAGSARSSKRQRKVGRSPTAC
jgi:hypothetical protein